MKKILVGLITAVVMLVAMGTLVNAQEPMLRDDVPDTYTVVKGDTLWDISATFLKNPWMWPEIWHVNAQIENPHLIYPGDVIRLVYFAGQPRLTLDNSGRIYKMDPKTRVLSAGDAIETIPLENINSFLSRSRVVSDEELEQAPYILSGADGHLITGAGDYAYVRGDVRERFSVFGLYRRGENFVDPETKEFLGVQALDIGSGEITAIDGEIATMEINRTTEEVRTGDRLLRQEERAIDSIFYPSPPSGAIEGVILTVEGGVNQVGKMDVVVINRGEREGLVPGNVLAVYKRGGLVKDRVSGDVLTLPNERAGLLMVFRTFEKVSFGLVLEASRDLRINDIVKNP